VHSVCHCNPHFLHLLFFSLLSKKTVYIVCLTEHQYKIGGVNPESDRILHYFSDARIDGLCKMTESPLSLEQEFTQRDDHLVYRHVQFGLRPKKFGPAEYSGRPIEVIEIRVTSYSLLIFYWFRGKTSYYKLELL